MDPRFKDGGSVDANNYRNSVTQMKNYLTKKVQVTEAEDVSTSNLLSESSRSVDTSSSATKGKKILRGFLVSQNFVYIMNVVHDVDEDILIILYYISNYSYFINSFFLF